jgi:hypothetical protein
MPVGLNENPVGLIDPACPLDWNHPLNRGLVSRWKVIPNSGWRGGLTFRDLARGGKKPNDGTLTNGPTWVGGGRRGRYGAISTDGSDDTIIITEPGINSGSTDYVFSIWVYPNRSSVAYHAVFDMTSRHFCMFINDAGQFTYGENMTLGLTTATNGLSYGGWHHLVLTRKGSDLSSYVDGVFKETVSNTGWISPAVQTEIHFGGNPSTGGSLWLGMYDDIAFWVNRSISATEVAQLYQEQLRGSPETLKWVGATTYGFSEQGGVVPATQYQYRSLLGVGV